MKKIQKSERYTLEQIGFKKTAVTYVPGGQRKNPGHIWGWVGHIPYEQKLYGSFVNSSAGPKLHFRKNVYKFFIDLFFSVS